MAKQNPEAAPKKPSVTEGVQSLIDKKKAERADVAHQQVSESMVGTKEGVAEVMAGVEKPSEKVSERKGESGQKGDLKTSTHTSDEDDVAQVRTSIKDYHFPSEEIMVKKIRTAINAQIKQEWKKAITFQKNLDKGAAADYNQSIARIRGLKQALSSLFTATKDYMRNLYVKYFQPDGKRRHLEDL